MNLLPLLCALALPTIAWLAQRGLFGPDPGSLAERHPTLLAAGGYAFSIWALIFLLDVLAAGWIARQRQPSEALRGARPAIALGFALCAAWMVAFPLERFGLALALIWAAWASLLVAALRLARTGEAWGLRSALNLHLGWLSLAVFLNLAQVIVAQRWLDAARMLPWTLALWLGVALLLMLVNRALRGHWAYVAAVLWGLLGVQVRQSASALPGAEVSAGVALGLTGLFLLQTLWLWWRAWRSRRQRRSGMLITLVNLR